MAGYSFGDFFNEYILKKKQNAMANPQMTPEEAYQALQMQQMPQAAPPQTFEDRYEQEYIDPIKKRQMLLRMMAYGE